MDLKRFNVRVYFALRNAKGDQLLIADEIIRGKAYTKFPGGGLEFGEGPIDCALREAREELGQEIEITGHLYTTDFFLPSAFRPEDQVISIYYHARLVEAPRFRTSGKRFDFLQEKDDEESFRWVDFHALRIEEFELPADRLVADILRTSQVD